MWQGVQILSLAYVPAGQVVMHSFFKGLRLPLEHFVQVMSTVEDLLAEESSEHSAQFSMPPSDALLHEAHLFPLSASFFGNAAGPHCDTSTHVPVEPLSAFKYVLPPIVLHLLHLLLPASVQIAQFSSSHPIQESVVAAVSEFLKYPSAQA